MATCAVARRRSDGGVKNDSSGRGAGGHVHRLDVFLIGADIAHMRKGEGDDLAGIGGISQDFLVAGHGGVEADLADRMAGGAKAKTFEQWANVEPAGTPSTYYKEEGPVENPYAADLKARGIESNGQQENGR